MSFVLGTVCLWPTALPDIPSGPLIIKEAIQDEDAWRRACYVGGLQRYFGEPVEGRCYYVYADTGERYRSGELFLSSAAFFPWPENDPTDTEPIGLRIAEEHREQFHRLLTSLADVSSVGRLLVIGEWNGVVTSPRVTDEELAASGFRIHGPLDIAEFWVLHDAGAIA